MNWAAWWGRLDEAGFGALRLLLAVLWQSSVLMAAVAGLALALRRRRAAVRHAVWTAALLIVPLVPLLGRAASRAETPRAELAVIPAYKAPVVAWVPETMDSPQFHAPAAAAEQPTFSAPKPAPKVSPLDYPWALGLMAYASGAGLLLLLVALGRLRLRAWARAGNMMTDGRVLEAFAEAAGQLGLRARPLIVASGQVRTPLTLGAFRPIVLLPAGLTDRLSAGELRAIALHELAHVKRRDPLVLGAASVLRAILFFHPLVWAAARQVSRLAESACDDAVLDAGAEPVPYARMLARLAADLPRFAVGAELAAGFVLSRSAFLKRVEAILSGRRDEIRRLTRLALAATVIGGLLSLGLALALPLGEKIEPPDGPLEVMLPSGVSVELLGAAPLPSEGEQWWRPDGSLLAEAPCPPDYFGDSGLYMAMFAAVLRLDGPGAETASVRWRVDPPGSFTGGGRTSPDGRPPFTLRRSEIGVPPEAESCSMTVGVAAGEWEELASYDGQGEGATLDTLLGKVSFVEPFETENGVALHLSFDLPDRDWRVVAIDGEWNVHTPSLRSLSGWNAACLANVEFPNLALIDVQEFVLETRAYDWIEFRDVSLRPGRITAPVAEAVESPLSTVVQVRARQLPDPAPATDGRAELPGGGAVELVGVNHYPSKGRQWWRPDGTQLAEAPSDGIARWGSMSQDERPYTHEFAVRAGAGPDAARGWKWDIDGMRASFGSSSPRGAGLEPDGMYAIGTELPGEPESTTVRIGVAGGDWEETCTLRSGAGGTGWGWGGAACSRPYELGDGTAVTLMLDLGDRQARLVAVGAGGREHVERIVARDMGRDPDPWLETVNFGRLKLDQIEEFRLETRPYEWAEFTDVALRPQGEPRAAGAEPPMPYVVSGQVTGPDGKPMEGVEVRIDGLPGKLGVATTGADGRYAVRFMREQVASVLTNQNKEMGLARTTVTAHTLGHYERNLSRHGNLASALRRGAGFQQHDFAGVLVPGEAYELDFTMLPAAHVTGRVVDPEGRPLANRLLWVEGLAADVPPSQGVVAGLASDQEGGFSVWIPCRTYWFATGGMQVNRERSNKVDFSTPGAYRVELTVDDSLTGVRTPHVSVLQRPRADGVDLATFRGDRVINVDRDRGIATVDRAVLGHLDDVVTVEFENTEISQVVGVLQALTEPDYVLLRRDLPTPEPRVDLAVEMSLRNILDHICEQAGMAWTVDRGLIKIGAPESIREPEPRIYDVTDLLLNKGDARPAPATP